MWKKWTLLLVLATPLLRADAAEPTIVSTNGLRGTQSYTELGRTEQVAFKGLREWAKDTKNNPNNLRLFLAGHMLPKTEPTLISLSQNYLKFPLDLNLEERQLWVQILSEARSATENKIPVSVGLENTKQPFDSDAFVRLIVYPAYTPLIVGLVVLLLAGLLWLAHSSALLREGDTGSPYSLGRVQMACWFYLVIGAYLYIWLITGEYNSPTPSVLVLIGISGSTGLAAVFVDKRKSGGSDGDRKTLETRQSALTARIRDLAAGVPPEGTLLDQELQQKRNALIETTAAIAALPAAPRPAVSKNWLMDILSDGDGVSFHRFQMAVWTLALACIFIRSVYSNLAMPDFDGSLLGLMGISAGTYVGFKVPETPKTADSAGTAPAAV